MNSTPTVVLNSLPNLSLAEYSDARDANATDEAARGDATILESACLYPIFYSWDWLTSSPSSDDVMAGVRDVLQSPYLSELSQYGFSDLYVSAPIWARDVTPTPEDHTTDFAGTVAWSCIDNGIIPEPEDINQPSIFMVFFPPGTAVTDPNACGWHSEYADVDGGDVDWAFVGGVDCPTSASATDSLKGIIKVFTHELVEIITDPEGSGGWEMNRVIQAGTEIGDACNHSVDVVDDYQLSAYWSERLKTCVIPMLWRRIAIDVVDVADSTLDHTLIASGTAHMNPMVCLNGDYQWTMYFNERITRFTAEPLNFTDPQFEWSLPDRTDGSPDLPQNNLVVHVQVETWHEDVNGVANSFQILPLFVTANGGTLTVVSYDHAYVCNFLLRVEVTVSEGTTSTKASKEVETLIVGEAFRFEDRYYKDLAACEARIRGISHKMKKWIGPIPKEGPIWVWENRLSRWIDEKRLELAADAAATAAALETFHPAWSRLLRRHAALVARVPATMLMAKRITVRTPSGRPVRTRLSDLSKQPSRH